MSGTAAKPRSLFAKLGGIAPALPRSRYGVYSGTNDWDEWRAVFNAYVRSAEGAGGVKAVRRFEQEFAAAAGVRFAFAFGAGRMSLYAILEAMGIGPGDEVVIPAFTCVVVPNALIYRGVTPVYADISPRTFNVDPARIEAAITSRTRAIYAQHTFGVPCDMEAIRSLAKRYGLSVIEDAAHALGARWTGQLAGSLGDAAFFSTDHSKVINTGLGGVAVTSDEGLAHKLAAIQQRAPLLPRTFVRGMQRTFLLEYALLSPAAAWLGRTANAVLMHSHAYFHFADELQTQAPTQYPYPCRMPDMAAELGISQLRRLDANLAHRRQIATFFEQRIGWYGASLESGRVEPTWLRYSFLVRDRRAFERRLRKRFDLAVWFTSVVQGRDINLEAVGYKLGSCPQAERVARQIVNIPTHRRIPLSVIESLWTQDGAWIMENILSADE